MVRVRDVVKLLISTSHNGFPVTPTKGYLEGFPDALERTIDRIRVVDDQQSRGNTEDGQLSSNERSITATHDGFLDDRKSTRSSPGVMRDRVSSPTIELKHVVRDSTIHEEVDNEGQREMPSSSHQTSTIPVGIILRDQLLLLLQASCSLYNDRCVLIPYSAWGIPK